MPETTSQECLRAAYQALRRGDTVERDRLCARATTLLHVERHAGAVEKILAIDFYVNGRGVAIPTQTMARAAGVMQ